MKIAQINNGAVVNVLEVDPLNIPPEMTDWPEVTEGVGIGCTFDGETFAQPINPEPVIAPEQVKQEAERRILAIVPEWKQRNLTARGVTLTEKGRENWTPEEAAEWDAGEAIWEKVCMIRDASDVIEAMDPIPADFNDDKHWPEV